MKLNLPSYAAIFLPYSPPTPEGVDPPESDKELKGELEIMIPHQDDRRGRSSRGAMGGVRVKAIRIVLRTYLNITTVVAGKKGKEQAERVIFERKIENLGGDEGILLEEGTQRWVNA